MDENKKKLVTILVPAYNEEEVLNMLYDRLQKLMDENEGYDFEVLLVKMTEVKIKHFKLCKN